MNEVLTFLGAHPPAAWAAVAGLFLVVELATGSGWLLWPCAAAAVVAAFAVTDIGGWLAQLLAFAVLTVVSTVLGRRWMAHRRTAHAGPDLNDPQALLVGRVGEVTAPFQNGRGRVFVSGKDWAADLDQSAEAPIGAPVRVLGLLNGSRLKVVRT